MGKRIIQQARGKGSPTYKSPGFKFKADSKIKPLTKSLVNGRIVDFVHCSGHNAPLMRVFYDDNQMVLFAAPEGVRVGDMVSSGPGSVCSDGNILALKDIPEGTPIYNIESQPGDGGKFCKSSGGFARVAAKTSKIVTVIMPSKRQKKFNACCRAVIGIIAGGGRHEKPFLKAGNKMFKMRAKNKLYPRTSACAMNAVDHPLGNSRSARKARNKAVSKHVPAGKKVGSLWPKRTGKRK
ncbi:50S ribosomal protein L2 [Candidatus Woesearchaeota archaeon]|nr:50S ribosomal protein L2 [Candidatus Woesearchaeota archaeon]MBW2978549.1 50S ribosomal protein L2 [Candidatus Woesearchaeota archaeon]